jgi:putative ABC transport system permease protein
MRSRLRPGDVLRVGGLGLRARRLRSGLSALGVSIGIAAIVGVLGISASSQADLLAQLDRLGTNLLSVGPGTQLGGGAAHLPVDAPLRIGRIAPVQEVAATGLVPSATVRRSDLVPLYDSGAIGVRATDVGLLGTVGGTLHAGAFLNAATASLPAVVLGSGAAQHLGIADLRHPVEVMIGGQWFGVVGILDPVALAPELDRSVLVGFPIAGSRLGFDGSYTTIYLRSLPDQTPDVQSVLGRTADPAHPDQVAVSRPSDVLAARAAARGAYSSLFLGLGAISLLVGGVGIANVMFVSVLERRSEIGLRRALGATSAQVGVQFLTESLLLSALGGAAGVAIGAAATLVVARASHWTAVVPALAVWGGLTSACAVGVAAGLYPALRAARLSPTEALRSV